MTGKFPSDINVFRGEYDFLSNFYPCQIEYQGIWYQSAEAAFQAQKCMNEDDKLGFCGLSAARAKFFQNPHLAERLLATDSRLIAEGNAWGDVYWGVDIENGKGENHLGQILMQVRRKLGLLNGENEKS